jgi:hypothetical protein
MAQLSLSEMQAKIADAKASKYMTPEIKAKYIDMYEKKIAELTKDAPKKAPKVEKVASKPVAKKDEQKVKKAIETIKEHTPAAHFKELVKKLVATGNYDFLKEMSKKEIENDLKRSAKPAGWRFRGNGNNKVPTKGAIKHGSGDGSVYFEGRANRSDVSRSTKL